MKVACAATLLALVTLTPGVSADSEATSPRPLRVEQGAASGSVVLDNEYVRVLQNAAACAAARSEGFGTRVIVALSSLTIDSSRGAVALERGGVANVYVRLMSRVAAAEGAEGC